MKCGFYEREITPPIGSDIPGYMNTRLNTNIHDRLFVKAAAVSTGERVEDVVIMMEMDVIFVPVELYDKALAKIKAVLGIPRKNILLAATHTHTGGPVYPEGEFRRENKAWMEMTTQSVADCAIMAYRSMKPAEARFGEGRVEGQAFSRDYLLKDGNIRTNPGFHSPLIQQVFGKADPAFPTLFFFDEEGTAMGALTNFACHHDCKAGTEISADFSGVLAKEMKKSYGPDFVNILFSGACGNINSYNPLAKAPRKNKDFLEVGWALAEEERRLFDTAYPIDIDRVDSVKKVLPIWRREVTPEQLEEAHWLMENVPVDPYQMNIAKPDDIMFKRCIAEDLIRHAAKPKNFPAMVQVIRLGELTIFALPCEVYCEYGLFLKEHSKTRYNMICTCSNRSYRGYVPTPEVFGTTVYPAQLPSAPMIPEAGQMIADFALEMMKELY